MIYTFKYYAPKVRKYTFRVDNSSFVFFLKNYSHFCYFFFIVPHGMRKISSKFDIQFDLKVFDTFYSSKHLSNECQNLIPSLFVITVSRKRGTSWFSSSIDEISYSAGSYFKFAGDLQESSSRWKVVRYAFRMLSDRSPRSIQKIVTLRNRRRLIRVNAKSSLLILFLPLLLLFFSLPPLFRVFVSQIIDRATRDAHARGTKMEEASKEREKERDGLKDGSDGCWSHDFCLPEKVDD